MVKAITNALDCHRVCHETSKHCQKMGGKHAEARLLTLLRDCAEICVISAHFMIRESEFHKKICELCAEMCEHTAKICDKFGEDAQMKECADVCRTCAKSCSEMVEGNKK